MAHLFKPKDRASTEHRGAVEKVVFSDPAQPFVILALTDGATVCGPADADTFTRGTIYRFLGRWEDNERRGPRFRFSTHVVHAAHGRAGVVKYLTEACDGIGAKTAERIYKVFGGASVETLRSDPAKVAAECGLEIDLCEIAAIQLASNARFEDTRIDLFTLFAGRGFQGKLIEQAIDKWGVKAPATIKRNPFALLGMPSAGFKRCDRLWSDLALPKNSLKRTAIVAAHLVKTDGQGHTWLAAKELAGRLREMIPGADVMKAFKLALRARFLKKHRDDAGATWLSTYSRATAEERAAAALKRLMSAPRLWPTGRVPVSQADGDRLPSQHQVDRLARATSGPVGLLLGGPGTGKAVPLHTPVLTPLGYREIGNIRVGDYVTGSDGNPTRVNGVYPQGEVDIYLVQFSDGSTVECCGEHLWFTATRQERKNARRRELQPFALGKVRNTREIAATLHSTDEHANHYIPLVKPVRFAFPQTELPIDPYVLGVLLGDGHLGEGCVQLTTPDDDLAAAVAERLPAGVRLTKRNDPRPCPSYQVSGTSPKRNLVLDSMRDLGLAGHNSPEKFIPLRYKYGTPEQRLAVLQGLLDTDGYTDGHNVEYSTSSPRLADDVEFIVESLGGTCAVSWRDPKYTHNGEQRTGKRSARVLVKLPSTSRPFRLKRKEEAYITRTKYEPYRHIVSIEPIGRKEAVCISVDAPDALYVCHRFIVTHNTHCTAFLLRDVIAEFGRSSITLAAPTGKAAVRMTQALSLAGLDLAAKTIHSTLEIGRNGHDGDGWGFLRGPGNPLDCRFLVLDEVSMCDADIMADVLDACATGTNVLLVGDAGQLPPVGHGAPLRDLIAAGMPHGELTQVRRNAGQIVHACARIRNGESFEVADRIDLEPADGTPPKNLKLVEARSEKEQVEKLVETLKSFTLFNPVWQTQVIVARNTKGDVCRKRLNDLLHPMLNPDGYAVKDNVFKVGDKIICTRNSRMHRVEPIGQFHEAYAAEMAREAGNYEAVRDPDGQPEEVYVANGEIGRVVAVAPKLTVARFSEGDALVKIPMGRQREEDEGEGGEDDGGGRGCNFDLAYAVTCHKLQGSEAPCVIVVGDEAAAMLTTREWIYTAISRASKLCVLIGKMSTFDKMRSRVALNRRKTFLRERVFADLVEGL